MNKRKKKKNTLRWVFRSILVFVILAYLGIGFFYQRGFSFGTWINGIYCTGKTVEEVNEALLEKTEISDMKILYSAASVEEKSEAEEAYPDFDILELSEVVTGVDYTEQLQELMNRQNPFCWLWNGLKNGRGYELSPSVQYDEKSLKALFEALPGVMTEQKKEKTVAVVYTRENGFVLQNGKSHALNVEKVWEAVNNALQQWETTPGVQLSQTGEYTLSLEELNCYEEIAFTKEDQARIQLIESLHQFLNYSISYDLGDTTEILDYAGLCGLVQRAGEMPIQNADGTFSYDDYFLEEYVNAFCAKYDTCGMNREFITTEGKTVTVQGGTYGNQIDAKTELDFLKKALTEGKSITREPIYTKTAWVRGVKDIDDTYIEINLTRQKMRFYLQGELKIDTPVVTGNMLYHRGTPVGTYYVYGKQKNRNLRGPGYSSHVNYWMPVNKGIGIHDALWRDDFGGDIYQTKGSHGCINTPIDQVSVMYDLVEIGMPVVIFYEENEL